MKATGIVRRIDDLGRIVIPKEMKRELNIREGDPLEVFVDGKSVIFQKYYSHDTESLMDELHNFKYRLDLAEDKDRILYTLCQNFENELKKLKQ